MKFRVELKFRVYLAIALAVATGIVGGGLALDALGIIGGGDRDPAGYERCKDSLPPGANAADEC